MPLRYIELSIGQNGVTEFISRRTYNEGSLPLWKLDRASEFSRHGLSTRIQNPGPLKQQIIPKMYGGSWGDKR